MMNLTLILVKVWVAVVLMMGDWSSHIMNDDLVFDKPLQARLDREQYYHYKWMFWKEVLNSSSSYIKQC